MLEGVVTAYVIQNPNIIEEGASLEGLEIQFFDGEKPPIFADMLRTKDNTFHLIEIKGSPVPSPKAEKQ